MNTQRMVRGGIIAALYIALTYAVSPFAYGPLQFRISEAMTILPIFYLEAIPGLFIGTLIANILGGLGVWDIVGGSLTTLLAAWVTHKFRHNAIAFISPIVLNAVLISLYLSAIFGMPYWLTALYIGASEAVVVLALGYPLYKYLAKRRPM